VPLAVGAVVASSYGINVTLSAEYWQVSGTSIASTAISAMNFEWFYTRDDGGRSLHSSTSHLNLSRFVQSAVLCPVCDELCPVDLVTC